jgi:hypothetical protein
VAAWLAPSKAQQHTDEASQPNNHRQRKWPFWRATERRVQPWQKCRARRTAQLASSGRPKRMARCSCQCDRPRTGANGSMGTRMQAKSRSILSRGPSNGKTPPISFTLLSCIWPLPTFQISNGTLHTNARTLRLTFADCIRRANSHQICRHDYLVHRQPQLQQSCSRPDHRR